MSDNLSIPSHGNDPTANVLNLVGAAVDRLEDLRKAEEKRVDDKIEAAAQRLDQRIHSEIRRIDEAMELRSASSIALNVAEAKRIDAIRAVDVAAVATANEKATAQATVLATQVSSSAETLRALVAQTAATVAQQLAQVSSGISDRLSALEKSSYEGIGKGRVVDPQMEAMLTEIKHLREAQREGTGKSAGANQLWAYLIGAIGLAVAIFALARP